MTATEQTDERQPLDKALDLGVFAPLGFVLEFQRFVPELAEAGRRHIELSRSLGKVALRAISRSAAAKATPPGTEPCPPGAASSSEERSTPGDPTPGSSSKASAIAGYDQLTAREIIDRCPSANEAQRAWMLDREKGGKARVTVLRALNA